MKGRQIYVKIITSATKIIKKRKEKTMITLYFERVKDGQLKNTTISDTYFDESLFLKEKPDGTYICILSEEEFVKQEAYAYFIKNKYISIDKKYVLRFDQATSDGLIIDIEVDFAAMFKENPGLYDECRESFDSNMKKLYDFAFQYYTD